MQNFTLTALLESCAVAALLGAFLLPSGFLFGRLSNLFGFRTASGGERLLISTVLSIAIVPSIAVTVERFLGVRTALIVFVVLAAAAMFLFIRDWTPAKERNTTRTTKIGAALMLAWALLALFSLVDWQIGDRLYSSAVIYDHSVRVPFVGAVIRDGVPPHNPFYNLDGSPVLRYYYYWYVVAALPGQLARLSARACLNGSILWCGFALAALVPLFLKHFFQQRHELRRKSVIGITLLLVTGLDLIPYAIVCARNHMLFADMEWWDPNQVSSWMGSLLWVPHHVAALIACMVGLLVLSSTDRNVNIPQRIWSAVLAALALSSAAGLSLYVTFTFAVFSALWIVVLTLQRNWPALMNWLAASLLSFLFAAPFLRDLLTKTSGAGSRFAVFALRDFPAVIQWLQTIGIHNPAILDFAKLPILVFVYFVEFGFFGCVVLILWKRELLGAIPMNSGQRCAWLLFASCLFVVTVFKSETTGSNDLGFRGVLPVQFVLLLWAALVVYDLFYSPSSLSRAARVVLFSTLVVGVLGTLAQLTLLRGSAIYADTTQKPRAEGYLRMPEIGRHAYLLRTGLAQLEKRVKRNDVYQFDTASPELWGIHIYANHPFAAGDFGCGTDFGGNQIQCANAMRSLDAPYRGPMALSAVDAICSRYGVSVLLVTDLDPVWHDRGSWVWQREPLVANQMFRALPCGSSSP